MRITRYLWINNLPQFVTEEDIRNVLNSHGKIQNIRIHEGVQHRGAVVAFLDTKSATRAVESSVRLNRTLLRLQYCESSGVPCSSSVTPKPGSFEKSEQRPRSTSKSDSRSIGGDEIETDSSSTSPYSSYSSSSHGLYSKKMNSSYSPVKRDHHKENADSKRHSHRGSRGPCGNNLRGLRVTHLPLRSSDTNLREGLFHEYKKHGKITSIVVKGSGPNRFAHITFKLSEDAEKAYEHSRGKVFFGVSVRAEFADGLDFEDPDLCPPEHAMDEYHPKATKTLFVGNLCSSTITQEELRRIFETYGDIIEIDIKTQTNQPGTSYAFVQYCDIKSVVRALYDQETVRVSGKQVKLGFGKSQPSNVVWLDNLSPNITETFLGRQFGRYGRLNHVVLDRKLFRALLYFDTVEAAQRALNETRNRSLIGKKVQIDYATYECQVAFMRKLAKVGDLNNLYGNYREKFQEILAAYLPGYGSVFQMIDDGRGCPPASNRRSKDSSYLSDLADLPLLGPSRSKIGSSRSHHSNSRSGSPGRVSMCSSRNSPSRDTGNPSSSSTRGHLLPNPGLPNSIHYKQLSNFPSSETLGCERRHKPKNTSSGRFDESSSSKHRSRLSQSRKSVTQSKSADHNRVNGSYANQSDYTCSETDPSASRSRRSRPSRNYCPTSSCSESSSPERIHLFNNWSPMKHRTSNQMNEKNAITSAQEIPRTNDDIPNKDALLNSRSRYSSKTHDKTSRRASGSSTPSLLCDHPSVDIGGTKNNFASVHLNLDQGALKNAQQSPASNKLDEFNSNHELFPNRSISAHSKPVAIKTPLLEKPIMPVDVKSDVLGFSDSTKNTSNVTSMSVTSSGLFDSKATIANDDTLSKLEHERAELLRQLSLLNTASNTNTLSTVNQSYTNAGIGLKLTDQSIMPYRSMHSSFNADPSGNRVNGGPKDLPSSRLTKRDFSLFSGTGGSAGHSSSSDPGDVLFSPVGQGSEILSPLPAPHIPSTNSMFHSSSRQSKACNFGSSPVPSFPPTTSTSPVRMFGPIASPQQWDRQATTIETDIPLLTRRRLPSSDSIQRQNRDPRLLGPMPSAPLSASHTCRPLWVETNAKGESSSENGLSIEPHHLGCIVSPIKPRSDIDDLSMSDSEQDPFLNTDAIDSLDERIRLLDAKLMNSEKLRPTVDYSKFRIRRKSDLYPPLPATISTATVAAVTQSPLLSPNSPFLKVSPPAPLIGPTISPTVSPALTGPPADTSEFVKSMLTSKTMTITPHPEFSLPNSVPLSFNDVTSEKPKAPTFHLDKTCTSGSCFLTPSPNQLKVTPEPDSSHLTAVSTTTNKSMPDSSVSLSRSSVATSSTVVIEVQSAVSPLHRVAVKQITPLLTQSGSKVKPILKRSTPVSAASTMGTKVISSKEPHGLHLKDLFSPQATQSIQNAKKQEKKMHRNQVKVIESKVVDRNQAEIRSDLATKRKLSTTTFPHPPKSPKLLPMKTAKVKGDSEKPKELCTLSEKDATVPTNSITTTKCRKDDSLVFKPKKVKDTILSDKLSKKPCQFGAEASGRLKVLPKKTIEKSVSTSNTSCRSMGTAFRKNTSKMKQSEIVASNDSLKLHVNAKNETTKRRRLKNRKDSDEDDWKPLNQSTNESVIGICDPLIGTSYESMYDKIKRRANKDNMDNKSDVLSKPEALKSFLKTRKKIAKRRGADYNNNSDSEGSSLSSDSPTSVQPLKYSNFGTSETVSKKSKKLCSVPKASSSLMKPPLLKRECSQARRTKQKSGKKSLLKRPQPPVGPPSSHDINSDESDIDKFGFEHTKRRRADKSLQKLPLVPSSGELKEKKIKSPKPEESSETARHLSDLKKAKCSVVRRSRVRQALVSSDSDSASSSEVRSKSATQTCHKQIDRRQVKHCEPSPPSSASSSPRISRSCSPEDIRIKSLGALVSSPPTDSALRLESEEKHLFVKTDANELDVGKYNTVADVDSCLNDPNDEIPQLERQVASDSETLCPSPPQSISVGQCHSISTSGGLDSVVNSVQIEPHPRSTDLHENPQDTKCHSETCFTVTEGLMCNKLVASSHVRMLPENANTFALEDQNSVKDSPPNADDIIKESVVESVPSDLPTEISDAASGLALLSKAATHSMVQNKDTFVEHDPCATLTVEPVSGTINLFASVSKPLSTASISSGSVSNPSFVTDQTVQQRITLLLNSNGQTLSNLNAPNVVSPGETATVSLNNPTFVLAATPLSSKEVSLTPVTVPTTFSFVAPVSVDKILANRSASEMTVITTASCVLTPSTINSTSAQPLISTSISPVIVMPKCDQGPITSDQLHLTSYVKGVIERVKQEKDEENLYGRERVKRTRKAIQKSVAATGLSASVSILPTSSAQAVTCHNLASAELLPGQSIPAIPCSSLNPVLADANELQLAPKIESTVAKRSRKLSEVSSTKPKELSNADPYEPNFDEEFLQVQNQVSAASRSPVVENLDAQSVSCTITNSSFRDSVDEVIDSVVHGEFAQDEYVQKVMTGSLTTNMPSNLTEDRTFPVIQLDSTSKAPQLKPVASSVYGFQSSVLEEVEPKQLPIQLANVHVLAAQSNLCPTFASTTDSTIHTSNLLKPLHVLPLIDNTSNAPVSLSFNEQSFQTQTSPLVNALGLHEQKKPTTILLKTPLTLSSIQPTTIQATEQAVYTVSTSAVATAVSASDPMAALSPPSQAEASACMRQFAAQIANSYISLLNQQRQQSAAAVAAAAAVAVAATSPHHLREGAADLLELVDIQAPKPSLCSLPAETTTVVASHDVLVRSPHEAADYYAAAATMAAMAVMQPTLGRSCASDASVNENAMAHVISPHVSNAPPTSSLIADSSRFCWPTYQLSEDKFPLQWNGYMALKNDKVYVQMHYVAGNRDLIRTCMSVIADRQHSIEDPLYSDSLSSLPILRIAQRMRMENPQLEAVQNKLREPNNFCMCLALAGAPPLGSEYLTEEYSRNSIILRENFIMYMQEKVAAGIISCPSLQESPFVMHIFPPCEFSQAQLQQFSPELLQPLTHSAIPYMLIVVV